MRNYMKIGDVRNMWQESDMFYTLAFAWSESEISHKSQYDHARIQDSKHFLREREEVAYWILIQTTNMLYNSKGINPLNALNDMFF
jgi:hypothetical protein